MVFPATAPRLTRVHGRGSTGVVGTVLAAAMLTACNVGSPSDESDVGAPRPSVSGDAAGPGEPSRAKPSGQQCVEESAIAVADANTVTFAPINGVAATTATGEPLIVVGTVYTQDCQPVSGAQMSMWQTDGNGEYGPGHGTDNMQCCYLGGNVMTDDSGHFQLITVRPAHYRGQSAPPPAHIHLEVRHPDASPLHAEVVFSDDERLPANAQSLGYVVTTPTGGPEGWRAVAEIRLDASSGGS